MKELTTFLIIYVLIAVFLIICLVVFAYSAYNYEQLVNSGDTVIDSQILTAMAAYNTFGILCSVLLLFYIGYVYYDNYRLSKEMSEFEEHLVEERKKLAKATKKPFLSIGTSTTDLEVTKPKDAKGVKKNQVNQKTTEAQPSFLKPKKGDDANVRAAEIQAQKEIKAAQEQANRERKEAEEQANREIQLAKQQAQKEVEIARQKAATERAILQTQQESQKAIQLAQMQAQREIQIEAENLAKQKAMYEAQQQSQLFQAQQMQAIQKIQQERDTQLQQIQQQKQSQLMNQTNQNQLMNQTNQNQLMNQTNQVNQQTTPYISQMSPVTPIVPTINPYAMSPQNLEMNPTPQKPVPYQPDQYSQPNSTGQVDTSSQLNSQTNVGITQSNDQMPMSQSQMPMSQSQMPMSQSQIPPSQQSKFSSASNYLKSFMKPSQVQNAQTQYQQYQPQNAQMQYQQYQPQYDQSGQVDQSSQLNQQPQQPKMGLADYVNLATNAIDTGFNVVDRTLSSQERYNDLVQKQHENSIKQMDAAAQRKRELEEAKIRNAKVSQPRNGSMNTPPQSYQPYQQSQRSPVNGTVVSNGSNSNLPSGTVTNVTHVNETSHLSTSPKTINSLVSSEEGYRKILSKYGNHSGGKKETYEQLKSNENLMKELGNTSKYSQFFNPATEAEAEQALTFIASNPELLALAV